MNEIFSVNNKNELEDYKLIYPNDKKLKVNLSDGLTSASLKFGNETVKLNFFERLFNFNKLFISKYDYQAFIAASQYQTRDLSLQFLSNEGELLRIFVVSHIKIVNSQYEEVPISHIKQIKEIYFSDELRAVIIVIDENFCSMREREDLIDEMRAKNELLAKESRQKTLLKEVNDLLS
jgi:hypothetical protein